VKSPSAIRRDFAGHRSRRWSSRSPRSSRSEAWFACRRAQAAATAGRFSGSNFTYDGFIEDASFTKLREVAVTLSLPRRFAARAGAGSAEVTFAGRNLKTWTNYTGVDPELNSSAQAQFSTSDFLTLPQVRYFTARLALSF